MTVKVLDPVAFGNAIKLMTVKFKRFQVSLKGVVVSPKVCDNFQSKEKWIHRDVVVAITNKKHIGFEKYRCDIHIGSNCLDSNQLLEIAKEIQNS